MAFYGVRTVGYGVAQSLGRVSAVTQDTSYRSIRAKTYGSVKFLGDINAVGGLSRDGIRGRLMSRGSGVLLRGFSVNTGISFLDDHVRRLVNEQTGRVAQAARGRLTQRPTATGVFYIDTQVIEDYLQSDEVQKKLVSAANKLIAEIQTTAPRKTSDYANSFKYQRVQLPNKKYVLMVYTNDPAARYLEFGTSKMPAKSPIRKALERVSRNV